MPLPIQNNAPVELGKRKHQGAQTIVYFLVILAGTALKLENVGPTFPCFASDPSNRRWENKVVNNKIRSVQLEFNCNEDTFWAFQKKVNDVT